MTAEIKWIKITTDMFDDEKIDFITSLPDADSILVIWFRLLTMAGKSNAGGFVLLTEKIPYTDEMLAHKFKKPLNTVRLALHTFINLDMIEMTDRGIFFPNWEKHQNIEGMERIREQTRERVRKHREKQLSLEPCNVTVTEVKRETNGTDIEQEKEKRKRNKNITAIAGMSRTNTLIDLPEAPVKLNPIEAARKSGDWTKVTDTEFLRYFIDRQNEIFPKQLAYQRGQDFNYRVGQMRDNFIKRFNIPRSEVCSVIDQLLKTYRETETNPEYKDCCSWDIFTVRLQFKLDDLMNRRERAERYAVNFDKPKTEKQSKREIF